ncbi:hypothetical protein Efla_004230 [Eimeria flavescens]
MAMATMNYRTVNAWQALPSAPLSAPLSRMKGGSEAGRMGLEQAALLEVHCGLPLVIPTAPLASESTEADENSPDSSRNNDLSSTLYTKEAPMAAPLKRDLQAASDGGSAADACPDQPHLKEGWRVRGDGRRAASADCTDVAMRIASASPAVRPAAAGHEAAKPAAGVTQPCSSCGASSPSALFEDSESPSPTVCLPADETEEDEVVVYIDEVEDESDSDALVIVQRRHLAKTATERAAFRASWVESMMKEADRILLPEAAGSSPRRSARREAGDSTAGQAEGPGPLVADLLKRKLEAFAACMSVDALHFITQDRSGWREAHSDSEDATSPADSPKCSRRPWLSQGSPSSAQCSSRRAPRARRQTAAAGCLSQPQLPTVRRSLSSSSPAAALEAWGRFLKYARATSKKLPLRRRIGGAAGLQSDDDDEQAPLYMCRPGSVQRPSPLISHSLTQLLKASQTLFFKQFTQPGASSSGPLGQEGNGGSNEAPAQEAALHELHLQVQSTTSSDGPASGHQAAAVDKPADSAGSEAGEAAAAATAADEDPSSQTVPAADAVPLYAVTAESAALFGDLLRLEETELMLEASCTFRLAAAPASSVRSKRSQLAKPRASTESAESRGPRKEEVWQAPLKSDPAETSGHLPAPQPAADRHPEGESGLERPVSDAGRCSHLRRKKLGAAPAGEVEESRVVYTVQADEETLALSGLDSEFCARVEAASVGANRALKSLAQLERQQTSSSPYRQDSPEAAAAATSKRRKKESCEEPDHTSGEQQDSDAEEVFVIDTRTAASAGEDAAEEADKDQSLLAERLLLAHLMPYLPQYGPL